MADMLTQIPIFLGDFLADGWETFSSCTVGEWFYYLFPFFIFAEMPRYMIPAIIVPFLNFFSHHKAREETPREMFLRSRPLVSIIVPARNEEKAIVATILSLLETNYENKQIVVVDDGSTDRTYELAKPFAEAGKIELLKSGTETGRGGKAFAMNLALAVCRGDFIMQVDADTSFDRDVIEEMLGPFVHSKIGAVTGNIKVRNAGASLVTKFQMCEYLLSITLWRNWASRIGLLMQMAGGLSMFRREVINDIGGWDSELVEDADIGMKVRKLGLKMHFVKEAVAFTNVPETMGGLLNQRCRWERGFFRTFFRKHIDVMIPWRFSFSNFLELMFQFIFTVICPYLYYAYMLALIAFKPELLPFFIVFSYILYVVFFALLLVAAVSVSERRRQEWPYLIFVFMLPIFNEILRFCRAVWYILELFRLGYEDPHLPRKTWDHAPRW